MAIHRAAGYSFAAVVRKVPSQSLPRSDEIGPRKGFASLSKIDGTSLSPE